MWKLIQDDSTSNIRSGLSGWMHNKDMKTDHFSIITEKRIGLGL